MKYEISDPLKITDLALKLSVAETRGEAIEAIVRMYADLQSLDIVAAKLEVGRTTLRRWIDRTPELARRLREVKR